MRLGIAFFVTLAISVVTLRIAGAAIMLVGILVAAVMLAIGKREFGGMTGDVIGATNELVRLVSLLVILVIPKWL